jgi:hypothetical protein
MANDYEFHANGEDGFINLRSSAAYLHACVCRHVLIRTAAAK